MLTAIVNRKIGFADENTPLKVREMPVGQVVMAGSESDAYRIMDAAANRAREGLRVIEDFVRFGLNDRFLSQLCKESRHELATLMKSLPAQALQAARDTLHDVGTSIAIDTEYQRNGTDDVAQVAFKRVQEALRSLEEFSKVVEPLLAIEFEKLRYQLYTAEKAVMRTAASRDRLSQQMLYLLVTESICESGVSTVVHEALAAGVRMIQLREKSMPDRELLEAAHRLRGWTRAANALLIINDRPDIAVLSDADGVHVGQEELSVRDVRRIVGPHRLIGVSTHSIEQVRQAVLDGADYLGVGPTFPGGTKAFQEFPGLELVTQVAAEIQLPWFAIGGIDFTRIGEVVAAGGQRAAVSGVICRSQTPQAAATELIKVLKSSWPCPENA